MTFQSQLFGGDPKLEAAAVSDPAHIFQGARGPHVGTIQRALTAIGAGVVNIDCNDRNFEPLTTKTRHGQMQDITRFEAMRDMRVHIKKVQFTR